ncbi:hypothetical protein ACNVED_07650 [Legionella sp. D16C41]|uniref:hypothetical protein n=1 Tax=Legionella sp. D16C41 TaxID=3402688 RepID=UPI003AF92AE8
MKINYESLKAISKGSNQVVVYGFSQFKYQDIYKAINDISDITNVKAFNCNDYQFTENIQYGKEFNSLYGHFKYLLDDLLLSNYKKQQKHEPIVPLIFIVGFNDKKYEIARILERVDHFDKGVSLAELRRCYKLATEFDKLTEVAHHTFNFVVATKKDDSYDLTVVDPPWKEASWEKGWEVRKQSTEKKSGSIHKNTIWRENYKKHIESTEANNGKSSDEDQTNTIIKTKN